LLLEAAALVPVTDCVSVTYRSNTESEDQYFLAWRAILHPCRLIRCDSDSPQTLRNHPIWTLSSTRPRSWL